MADFDFTALKKDLERRMGGALDVLHTEFSGLRSGRANAGMLDPITVNAYGSDMPLNQLGAVNVPEPRTLLVQVWDKTLVEAVEKAIRDADLGLNPSVDGQTIRIPIPPLTEERRTDMAKLAGKYAEESRINVRNVRRHGMESIKKADISEDAQHDYGAQVQELTDHHIKKVDDALKHKEADIMQV